MVMRNNDANNAHDEPMRILCGGEGKLCVHLLIKKRKLIKENAEIVKHN
jgi:hypothetical protein